VGGLLRQGVDQRQRQEVATWVRGPLLRLSAVTVILLENAIARWDTLQSRFCNHRPHCLPMPKQLDPALLHQRDRVQNTVQALKVDSQELLHQGLLLGMLLAPRREVLLELGCGLARRGHSRALYEPTFKESG
jgi:hypothetical protein